MTAPPQRGALNTRWATPAALWGSPVAAALGRRCHVSIQMLPRVPAARLTATSITKSSKCERLSVVLEGDTWVGRVHSSYLQAVGAQRSLPPLLLGCCIGILAGIYCIQPQARLLS